MMGILNCKSCLGKGHSCPVYAEPEPGEDALCLWCSDGVDCPVVKRENERTASEKNYCEHCHEKGHLCTSAVIRKGKALCKPCSEGKPCKQQEMELAARMIDKQNSGTELAISKPQTIEVAEPQEPKVHDDERDVRDLMKILSQTMAGVLTGTVTPAQSNAVCNAANTVLKIAVTAKKFRDGGN